MKFLEDTRLLWGDTMLGRLFAATILGILSLAALILVFLIVLILVKSGPVVWGGVVSLVILTAVFYHVLWGPGAK